MNGREEAVNAVTENVIGACMNVVDPDRGY
jgi:hypothetical protein